MSISQLLLVVAFILGSATSSVILSSNSDPFSIDSLFTNTAPIRLQNGKVVHYLEILEFTFNETRREISGNYIFRELIPLKD